MTILPLAKFRRGPLLPALAAVAAVVALGTVGGVTAYARASGDCCAAGAPCCHPGAACCASHHHAGAQRQ